MQLAKQSIDLGIVVRDGDAMLSFYRDTLGLAHVADIPLPAALPAGTMHRLACGETVLKLLRLDDPPSAANPSGGIPTAAGIRYFTIIVDNLGDTVDAIAAAGTPVVLPVTEVRPGVTVAFLEDPDGNWVELVEIAPAHDPCVATGREIDADGAEGCVNHRRWSRDRPCHGAAARRRGSARCLCGCGRRGRCADCGCDRHRRR